MLYEGKVVAVVMDVKGRGVIQVYTTYPTHDAEACVVGIWSFVGPIPATWRRG